MRKLTLKDNLYKHRFELIGAVRAVENDEFIDEITNSLYNINNSKEFVDSILYNYGWLTKHKIIESKYDDCSHFINGFAFVLLNKKIGFINTKGEEIIKPKFNSCGYFNEGFASVKLGNKYGFIKEDGRYLIVPIFDWCGDFNNGFARVESNDKYYTINTKGEIIGA